MSYRRRVIAGLSMGAVALSLAATPVGAVGGVIWVAKDGHAGPAGCAGAAAAKTTIRAGIVAAAKGDTVRVCPGTYREFVRIGKRDLTLVADSANQAIVKPPAPTSATVRPAVPAEVIEVAASGVTVRGFRIVVPSDGCTWTTAGIGARNRTGTTIRANPDLGGTTDESATCGLTTGVAISGGTATVANNTIRNFNVLGIVVADGAVGAVSNNTLVFAHTGTPPGTAGSPAGTTPPTFIRVAFASATVSDNDLTVDPDTLYPTYAGIFVEGSSVQVGDNVVLGAGIGIGALDAVSGAFFSNTVKNGPAQGIDLYTNTPVTIRNNRVKGYIVGIYTHGSARNIIKNNDFRGNVSLDCGDNDPKTSRWTNNLGETSAPSGLCSPT